MSDALLAQCRFPVTSEVVDVAVSGGPDSVGLLLLARAAGLRVRVHHVDHHVRDSSGLDAAFVADLARRLDCEVIVHDVREPLGPNFEQRARNARRQVLPVGTLTGHTMDDLAETILINMLRGAGVEGLSPMLGSPTKPLLGVRRHDVHAYVADAGVVARHDETNDDVHFLRNRVRHDVLPLLAAAAQRDVVPLLWRQAVHLSRDREWLDDLSEPDRQRALGDVDCRELVSWPEARTYRWLRWHLRDVQGDDTYPPTSEEVERAMAVVKGKVVACQLSGARRLSRSGQRLSLDEGSTTLGNHV